MLVLNRNYNNIIKIYKNDIFIGYVKSYRTHRNGKYRFTKTKNINDAIKLSSNACSVLKSKLVSFNDTLMYKGKYTFEQAIITEQEIRNSKLHLLKTKIIREGIFKNKIK